MKFVGVVDETFDWWPDYELSPDATPPSADIRVFIKAPDITTPLVDVESSE